MGEKSTAGEGEGESIARTFADEYVVVDGVVHGLEHQLGAEARALAAAHALRSAAAQLRSAQQPSWRRRPRHKPPPHTYVGRFLERVEPPGDACLVERAEVASPQTPSGGAWTTAYLSTSTLMR